MIRFSISHRIENDLALVAILDKENDTEVKIIPAAGGLLHSFKVKTESGDLEIMDSYKSLEDLKKNNTLFHKSSKMSPFVCRIENGKYKYAGNEFEFARKFRDGSAIHGLLYDKAFEITDELVTESSASITMHYHYKQDDAGYPFHYICLIRYQLKPDNYLLVETAVINTGIGPIPIADGWHPYFTLGGQINDLELSFQASRMLEFNERLIPTGQTVENKRYQSAERIEEGFLDNCFVLDTTNGKPACVLKNPKNGVSLFFFPGKYYPYLQLYTPPHRNSIAIENLSGAPNCFNNGLGLLTLDPGHSQTFTLGYQVKVEMPSPANQ